MNILEFKEAKNIPEKLLPSLVKSEVECWWSEPFSEYKICNDCKAIFSIEEVHGSVENFRKSENNWDDFECLECHWTTKYIYKTEEFLNLIKEYIKWDVSAVLLVSPDENVEWFCVLVKTNILWIVENEFNTRPNSYDKQKLTEILLEKTTSWIWDKVLCLHHLYVCEKFRGVNFFSSMMKKLFIINEIFKSSPIILETRYDSHFYSMSRFCWAINLIDDTYWYVTQIIKNYSNFLDFFSKKSWLTNNFKKNDLLLFKKESIKILENNKHFLERKFYY